MYACTLVYNTPHLVLRSQHNMEVGLTEGQLVSLLLRIDRDCKHKLELHNEGIFQHPARMDCPNFHEIGTLFLC